MFDGGGAFCILLGAMQNIPTSKEAQEVKTSLVPFVSGVIDDLYRSSHEVDEAKRAYEDAQRRYQLMRNYTLVQMHALSELHKWEFPTYTKGYLGERCCVNRIGEECDVTEDDMPIAVLSRLWDKLTAGDKAEISVLAAALYKDLENAKEGLEEVGLKEYDR